jgi:hypothetical protein
MPEGGTPQGNYCFNSASNEIEAYRPPATTNERWTDDGYSETACANGCQIHSMWLNNGFCDCAECEDEDNFTCETCRDGCPPAECAEKMGTAISDLMSSDCGVIFTHSPSPMPPPTPPPFTCNNGCEIAGEYVNDGRLCDCAECEDEDSFTCETCEEECPTECGAFSDCVYGPDPNPPFMCTSGFLSCPIFGDKVNDGACDCQECEDEDSWTCETCGYGCPWDRDGYGNYQCWYTVADCQVVDPECEYCLEFGGCELDFVDECADCNCPTYPPSPTFMCDDGCEFDVDYENDGFCDCAECEDEVSFTCETCIEGCFADCGEYAKCEY